MKGPIIAFYPIFIFGVFSFIAFSFWDLFILFHFGHFHLCGFWRSKNIRNPRTAVLFRVSKNGVRFFTHD